MPRAARRLVGNQVYHVLNRGNGRADVFHKPKDFEAFVSLIAEAKRRYPVKLLLLQPSKKNHIVLPEMVGNKIGHNKIQNFSGRQMPR